MERGGACGKFAGNMHIYWDFAILIAYLYVFLFLII